MWLDPLRFVAVALAGSLNRQQQEMIDYLRDENKALREQLGSSERFGGNAWITAVA